MTTYHDPRNLDEAMREIRDLRDAPRKHNIVVKERNELRSKLAALEGQEPVAWLVYANGSHRYSTLTFDVSKVPEIYVGGDVVALYTAAGAAPVPEGYALLSVEAIKRTLNCLNTPERADLRLVLRDLYAAAAAAAMKGEQP